MNKSVFHGIFKITGEFLQNHGAWTPAAPHRGLDMVGVISKQIFSPSKGKVEFAGNVGDGFGNYVRIRNEDGNAHYLCHMESIAVKAGQTVNYGDILGIMGATGNVTGPHTHFEIRDPQGNIHSGADYLGLPNKQGEYNDSQVVQVSIPTFTPTKSVLKVGMKVTVNKTANTYATGQVIASFVKGSKYTVSEIKSDKVLLKEIMSWVKISDITY
jgi:murein DD-endopeptidase MepM/ murein hydrolase activator NlpD